jgi:hypothetical protein
VPHQLLCWLAGGSVYQDIRHGKLMMLPTFSTQFMSTIKNMMSPKPADRPSAQRLLNSSLLHKRALSSQEATGGALQNQQQQLAGRVGGLVFAKSNGGA